MPYSRQVREAARALRAMSTMRMSPRRKGMAGKKRADLGSRPRSAPCAMLVKTHLSPPPPTTPRPPQPIIIAQAKCRYPWTQSHEAELVNTVLSFAPRPFFSCFRCSVSARQKQAAVAAVCIIRETTLTAAWSIFSIVTAIVDAVIEACQKKGDIVPEKR